MSTALSYYFNEEHESFRKTIRQFLEAEAIPNIDQWESDGKIPREFWKKFGEMGYFGLCYPEQYGGSNLDFFYNVVMLEEISKIFSGGFAITAAVQVFMSTPYIMHHGSDYLKENYLKPAIEGSKIGCIGITEPGAGSDAANIQMRARKEGDYYILNGSKTFITNGIYGHFVILVCKTNPDAGAAGVSLLVVDLNSDGIAKNKLKKLGWYSSDTAELHFDNVKVPAKNLLGEEGKGFYYLMGGLQMFAEDFLVDWVRACIKKTGVKKVALAGGTFMNVKANKRIMELPELESVFIFPSCGDESNPVGICWHLQQEKFQKNFELESVYWGIE